MAVTTHECFGYRVAHASSARATSRRGAGRKRRCAWLATRVAFADTRGCEAPRVGAGEFAARRDEWLPGEKDKAYIKNLMQPVLEPGKMANWINAPARGINGQPIDFEYIRKA